MPMSHGGFAKLAEECSELAQVCAKKIGLGDSWNHWDGSDLIQRFREESADVVAALQFIHEKFGIGPDGDRVKSKLDLFRGWDQNPDN